MIRKKDMEDLFMMMVHIILANLKMIKRTDGVLIIWLMGELRGKACGMMISEMISSHFIIYNLAVLIYTLKMINCFSLPISFLTS